MHKIDASWFFIYHRLKIALIYEWLKKVVVVIKLSLQKWWNSLVKGHPHHFWELLKYLSTEHPFPSPFYLSYRPYFVHEAALAPLQAAPLAVEVLARLLLLNFLWAFAVVTEAVLVRLESRVNCGWNTVLSLAFALIGGVVGTWVQSRVKVDMKMHLLKTGWEV